MLNNIEHLESNKDAIMGIARSYLVCLHTLLRCAEDSKYEQLYDEHIYVHTDRSTDISSDRSISFGNVNTTNNIIINNVSLILFDPKYAAFREKLVQELAANQQHDEAQIFNERLDIARNLPVESKSLFGYVISSLQQGKKKFLDWIFSSCIEQEHKYTQTAVLELLFDYLQVTQDTIVDPLLNQEEEYFSVASSSTFDVLQINMFGVGNTRELSPEKTDELVQAVQLLNSGILMHDDHDYMWKFKPDINSDKLRLSDIEDILECATQEQGADLSEKLSVFLGTSTSAKAIECKKILCAVPSNLAKSKLKPS